MGTHAVHIFCAIPEYQKSWCNLENSPLFLKNLKRALGSKTNSSPYIWENNLSKAINLLDESNKNDFKKFVNNEVSFNPHIMVICKSKEKLKSFYNDVFPWLERCEKIFGFENLDGYNKTRIYGFLGERFMSYWFQKNTKYKTMPVIIYDIRKDIS